MSLVIPDNYEIARKRMCNLEKRLAKCSDMAEEYNLIIVTHLEKARICH